MVLDSEEQRNILLHLVNSSNWPGSVAEKCIALKESITNATIADDALD